MRCRIGAGFISCHLIAGLDQSFLMLMLKHIVAKRPKSFQLVDFLALHDWFSIILNYIHLVQWELSAQTCFMKHYYMIVIRLISG